MQNTDFIRSIKISATRPQVGYYLWLRPTKCGFKLYIPKGNTWRLVKWDFTEEEIKPDPCGCVEEI